MAKTPFMVTLYFRGADLKPELITKRLKVSPTDTRRKGEQRFERHGRIYINPTGIWALETTTTSKLLSDHIDELTSKLKKSKKINDIAGAEEIFIDVFLCFERTKDSESYEFTLTERNIKELDRLGLPVRFIVSSFMEGRHMQKRRQTRKKKKVPLSRSKRDS